MSTGAQGKVHLLAYCPLWLLGGLLQFSVQTPELLKDKLRHIKIFKSLFEDRPVRNKQHPSSR